MTKMGDIEKLLMLRLGWFFSKWVTYII